MSESFMSTVSARKITGAKSKSRRESEIGQSVKASSFSSMAGTGTSEAAGSSGKGEEQTVSSNLRVAEIARRLASMAQAAAEAARRAEAPATSAAILGA